MKFEFPVTDTNQLYDLHLIMKHGVDFGFQNFYVNIKTFFPGGEELEERVSLQLANKFGQWYGECGGESCTLDIPIQQSAYFNEPGTYRVEIEQYSRENPLRSIKEIAFALEEKGVRN
jgi:gliding motility-associated lipoprotein GldH